MNTFEHLLYYDLYSPFRNAVLERELPGLCRRFTKILVDDDYPSEHLADMFDTCDCLVTGVFDNYQKVLKTNAKLRRIFLLASDTSDFAGVELKERGIRFSSAAGYSTSSVAELSIAMMILLARGFISATSSIAPAANMGRDLQGKKLLVLGAGRIGKAIGKRAECMGMEVQYSSNQSSRIRLGSLSTDLRKAVSETDVLAVALPATLDNRGILSRELLNLLRDEAIIVSPARIDLFDADALVDACREKSIGLWLDGVEDLKIKSRFVGAAANIIVTPSLGARSLDAQVHLAQQAIQELRKD